MPLSVAAEGMPSGNGKKGRAGGNGDNCLLQAQMKGSGPHGEVTPELCVQPVTVWRGQDV